MLLICVCVCVVSRVRCLPCQLAGGLIFNLTMGSMYTFGNLNLYITSYMRHKSHIPIRYKDTAWITTSGESKEAKEAKEARPTAGIMDGWMTDSCACCAFHACVCVCVHLCCAAVIGGGLMIPFGGKLEQTIGPR